MSKPDLAVLRTWKLRQPSPELRERIFSAEALSLTGRAAETQDAGRKARPALTLPGRWWWQDAARWMIPALGCLLLASAALSNYLPARGGVRLGVTNVLGEEGFAMAGGHSGVNAVPARKLEWNYGTAGKAASAGAVLFAYTNQLIGK